MRNDSFSYLFRDCSESSRIQAFAGRVFSMKMDDTNGGATMRMWKVMFLALVLAGSLVAVTNANAQNLQRGEIRGFGYDTSHAVVPNAKVTISNPSTGYKREFTTDASGSYGFPQLLPGVYKIQAEA